MTYSVFCFSENVRFFVKTGLESCNFPPPPQKKRGRAPGISGIRYSVSTCNKIQKRWTLGDPVFSMSFLDVFWSRIQSEKIWDLPKISQTRRFRLGLGKYLTRSDIWLIWIQGPGYRMQPSANSKTRKFGQETRYHFCWLIRLNHLGTRSILDYFEYGNTEVNGPWMEPANL